MISVQQVLVSLLFNLNQGLTVGNHLTTVPPPMSLPFHIWAGRLVQHKITGYPLTVPNDDSFDLSV